MGGLSAVYFVCFLAGASLSVASFLLGHVGANGHAGHFDASGDTHELPAHTDHAGHHLGGFFAPLLSASALSALACVGGGVGLLARLLGAGVLISLFFAVPAGLGAATLVGRLLRWLTTSTRYLPAAPAAGAVGKVLVRIGDGRSGEVLVAREGGRHALPAVSASGHTIEAGTEIVVTEIAGGVARVVPASEWLEEEGNR